MTALRISAAVFIGSVAMWAADKPRVFVTESHPLQITAKGTDGVAPFVASGGETRENVEVMKNFAKLCPGVVVTSNREKAAYVVRLDHIAAGPTTPFTRENKVAVFNSDEDLIYSGSTHLLAPAVKNACAAIAAAGKR